VTLLDGVRSLAALFEGGAVDARLPPRFPDVAIEITPDRIVGVRVEADRKTKAVKVSAVESHEIPDGAIEPSLTRPNVLAPEPVLIALRAIFTRLAAGEARVSLLIPDHVARVAILTFATLPRSRRELAELVRFRMAKSLPFKPEEAVMDLQVLSGAQGAGAGPGGASVLAGFIHRAVVEQYEGLFTAAGYWPGLVGLSTFELYNLFRQRLEPPRGEEKDALLVNATPHYLSMLIFRGEELIFYRCKPNAADAEDEGGPAGLRREIYTSLAFYQEKLLGRGLGRAFVRAAGVARETVREAVIGETGCEVAALDLNEVLPLAPPLSLGTEDASRAAPAAGAVAGRRS
jgi:hypothetical protein